MANGYDVPSWAATMRARIASEMRAHGGIAIIDDFLPRAVAEELRDVLLELEPDKWRPNVDHGETYDTPHTFFSCTENISDVTRILSSLMPTKMPLFSAARYTEGHSIARHNDARNTSDGCGGVLYRDTAIVLYLVDDWKKEDGGLFLDYGVRGPDRRAGDIERSHADADTVEPLQTVVPTFNRLVVFDVPRDHEVTRVTVRDNTVRPRLSIFGWFLRKFVFEDLIF